MKTAIEVAPNLTLVGIVIVFSALALISLLIWLYSTIIVHAKSSTPNSSRKHVGIDKDSANSSDKELIAVFTAAIIASMGYTSSCNLKIKSFRRVGQSYPVWNAAGRNEYIMTRL